MLLSVGQHMPPHALKQQWHGSSSQWHSHETHVHISVWCDQCPLAMRNLSGMTIHTKSVTATERSVRKSQSKYFTVIVWFVQVVFWNAEEGNDHLLGSFGCFTQHLPYSEGWLDSSDTSQKMRITQYWDSGSILVSQSLAWEEQQQFQE